MADQRRGLGRGLSALLGESQSAQSDAGDVRSIPIDKIHRNAAQPRVDFQEEELEELALSVRAKGVLQPILVRPDPEVKDDFQIVAGERRWRAAQRAGLTAMPALVRDLDDRETLEIALVENVQRSNLNPIEEATAYNTLLSGGRTQEEVAEVVGKSRPHVANLLRLLNLPHAVQTLVLTRALSAGHARAIIGAANVEDLARKIVSEGLSVREVEALVRRQSPPGQAPARRASQAAPKSPDTRALEQDLSERLGLGVEVRDRGGVGEVRIAYAALEQLDEICRRLSRS